MIEQGRSEEGGGAEDNRKKIIWSYHTAFTYENPFKEMSNNLFLFKSGTFGKICFSAPVAMDFWWSGS